MSMSEGEDEEEEEEEEEEPLDFFSWSYNDIMFYKGMLYALSKRKSLVCFNLEDQKPPVGHQMENMMDMDNLISTRCMRPKHYLVESCGELLMVYRNRDTIYSSDGIKYVTKSFLVFKLDKSGDALHWLQVDSLGDQMLFLGGNSSMSISAKGIHGFKGNCIYFSDDAHMFFRFGPIHPCHICSDNGVFYLDDGRIDSLSPHDISHFDNYPPVWISPNVVLGN
ncbi:hypothetical protein IFM89_002991 [Coptis chinensis]|uniref:KIB1-4 beta-propeller domain-containing protein n=1 Tax=Coptis chinensis TaxID=261450 RepID=A0A835MBE2_9MAGN|nr:hypothetical protein IFM89_002991 [Coptis chinensis]